MIKMLLGQNGCSEKKLNENGELICNRAILVCKGYAQQEGIDFE